MFPAFFSTSEVLVFLELIKTWEYHLKEVLVTGETTEQGACPTAAVRGWPGRCVRQSSLRGKAGRGGGRGPQDSGPLLCLPKQLDLGVGGSLWEKRQGCHQGGAERSGEAGASPVIQKVHPGAGTWEFPKPPVQTERSAQPCLNPTVFLPFQGSPHYSKARLSRTTPGCSSDYSGARKRGPASQGSSVFPTTSQTQGGRSHDPIGPLCDTTATFIRTCWGSPALSCSLPETGEKDC